MAHFVVYSTSDVSTGNIPLTGGQQIVLGPIQADRAATIAGSIFADQPGTLYVEQTMDGTNFDISQSIAVVANVGQGFNINVIAPTLQLRYVNGATPNTVIRLFARTHVSGN